MSSLRHALTMTLLLVLLTAMICVVSEESLGSSPTTYTITFTETGLPIHTNWTVEITNMTHFEETKNTNRSSMSFMMLGGDYNYTAYAWVGSNFSANGGAFRLESDYTQIVNFYLNTTSPSWISILESQSGMILITIISLIICIIGTLYYIKVDYDLKRNYVMKKNRPKRKWYKP